VSEQKTYPASVLRDFARAALRAAGCPPEHAQITAEILIESNLRGVDTHGVFLCDNYCRRLQRGLMNSRPKLTFEKTRAATGILDGDRGLGQVATCHAMTHAIELARAGGVGVVAVRNSNHFGAAAYYAQMAARRGCLGMLWSHGESDVVPFGGKRKFFGTNPICFAAPAGYNTPMYTADMATSQVAFGKIRAAGLAGKEIPAGWALDRDGNVLTHPPSQASELAEVSAVPMAGAKGYGVSVFIELTCSALTGMPFGPHIVRKFDNWQQQAALGHYVQAIDIEAFMPLDAFRRNVDEMFAELKACPTAPGFDEVLLPGEPELRTQARRERDGCPIPSEVHQLLSDLGAELGVEFPE